MNNVQRKILIKGVFGNYNIGDDALLIALLQNLKQRPDTFSLLGNSAPYLKKILGTDYNPPDSDFDCEILAGGTQFSSFEKTYRTYFGEYYKKLKKALQNPIWFARRMMRVRLRKNENKTIAVGLGVGPFHTKGFDKQVAISALRKMDKIFVRDKESLAFCKEQHIQNAHLFTDLCYALQIPKQDLTRERKRRKRVAIILRDWEHNDSMSSIEDKIEVLIGLRSDFEFEFLSFSMVGDEKINRFIKEKNLTLTIWDPYNSSLETFFSLMSSFDLFVTSRFHGAVFSTLLGKPFVAIEIEPKLRLVHEKFELGSGLWNCRESAQSLLDRLEYLDEHYNVVQKHVKTQLEVERGLAFEQLKKINQYIDGI